MATRTITLSASNWTQTVSKLYYDTVSAKIYADTALSQEVSSIPVPTRELYQFNGFSASSSSSSPGALYIDSYGSFTEAFYTKCSTLTANLTIYVTQSQVSYKITLNDRSGAGGDGVIYAGKTQTGFFSDWLCEHGITAVTPPEYPGYTFTGYWSAASGGTRRIASDGEIDQSWAPTANATVYAQYTANTYTLTFDYGRGTGSVASKTVTMGEPVGTLPTGVFEEGSFGHWNLSGTAIGATTVWNTPSDATAVAEWNYYFGRLTDYFGLATANGPLMLVKSDPGITRTVVETAGCNWAGMSGYLAIQASDSPVGGFALGPILMNPTCTYRIMSTGDVTIQLGKAWAKTGTTKSGYMIVRAEYATSADGEPLLVVSAAANEGYDAINRWNVTLHVSPDHVAQDPLGAVSGGGELTECKTLITCDPVVPLENGFPCASDVVHGKIIVTATTGAYFGESAPTAQSPFVEVSGTPNIESDVDYTSYAFKAERSL